MSVKPPIRIKRVRSQPGVFILNRKKGNKHVEKEKSSSQQHSDDEFEQAVNYVLTKNKALYERLA
ncbi:MAG: hypothetical protein LRZ84_22455 [Desertifilum sp.]|nr:hypothetical protein [Desertifilum sp.]